MCHHYLMHRNDGNLFGVGLVNISTRNPDGNSGGKLDNNSPPLYLLYKAIIV